jgi:peptidoglycan/LPS O-acetylase OafA/YrhL
MACARGRPPVLMNRGQRRNDTLLVPIALLTVVLLTARIIWIRSTGQDFAWVPAGLAGASGAGLALWLVRAQARNRRGGEGGPRGWHRLVIVGSVGFAPLISHLTPTWEIALLAFGDGFMAVVAAVALRRSSFTTRPYPSVSDE